MPRLPRGTGIALIVVIVLAGALVVSKTLAPEKAQRISAEQLKRLIDGKQEFLFLDVREPRELEKDGTIKGYVHIRLSELESRLSEVPRDKPIVAACRRGVRAARAAAILEKHGYSGIGYTGLAEYKAKGYELIYPNVDVLDSSAEMKR